MTPQPRSLSFVVFFGFALSVFGQMDASKYATDLRSKYGPALARESFRTRGIEMVVHFSANGHVCKIELPPVGPEGNSGVISPQAVDDLVEELVPRSLRGKAQGSLYETFSLHSLTVDNFENISISQSFQAGERTKVTITFKHETCQDDVNR
jgi:hypothetical protein